MDMSWLGLPRSTRHGAARPASEVFVPTALSTQLDADEEVDLDETEEDTGEEAQSTSEIKDQEDETKSTGRRVSRRRSANPEDAAENDAEGDPEASSLPYRIVEKLEHNEWLREVGDEGVWTLSSAKPGNGADQLRDGDPDTFWQSDGSHPHLINVHFQKKLRLQEVALYLDYRCDESYTPAKISIRVGTDLHDVEEVQCVELDQPQGWVVIPIGAAPASHMGPDAGASLGVCRAHVLQIAILQSHQNGRDTHVRQVKIFSPRESALRNYGLDLPKFTSNLYQMYSTIR